VIEELIQLARDLRAAEQRGEQLGLTEDEAAFYDALEVNDSAVAVLGDETLRGKSPRTLPAPSAALSPSTGPSARTRGPRCAS
jgi:hypothetical protein